VLPHIRVATGLRWREEELDVAGHIVTLDAMHCQKTHSKPAPKRRQIVQLKDNQPTLCRKVEAVCNDTKPLTCVQTVDSKKRNRHETRTVAVFNARPAVAGTEWQPHVAAIIAIERNVLTFRPATGLWDASRETALYLSNRPIHARKASDAVRKHWGIENKQHYTRDVTLREDA
jgi:predicted transposase YbfD/YdcC